MENLLYKKRWSPYVVGSGIGLLNVGLFYFVDKTIGASSAFERLGMLLYTFVAPIYVRETGRHLAPPPIINWHVALVVGIFFGAWISAYLSSYKAECISSLWAANFGTSWSKRALGAFVGGVIIMLGARIARGCTSGHGISGGMYLATASYLFLIALFASGIITAHVLYRKGR